MKVQFIKSAVKPKDYPFPQLPEIGFVGRSNAGKSSLINAITNSKIAKVSGTPGKTQLLNFFDVGEKYCLVDMPGYGFAKRSNKEQGSWRKMIENYLFQREILVGLVLIMDIRRNWSFEEQMIVDAMAQIKRPLVLVLNKTDKLNRTERERQIRKIKEDSALPHIYSLSAFKKQGVEELEEFLYSHWVKG